MPETKEPGPAPLSNAELARVLSPLLLFAAHVAYLAFWSRLAARPQLRPGCR